LSYSITRRRQSALQILLSDFLKLAALSSSACCSSADISGSKIRTTRLRPTMLGSDSVTRTCHCSFRLYDRPLIAKNYLRDPRRYDADAKLARVVAFDNSNIGIPNALFDLLSYTIEGFASLRYECANRHTGDAGGRPKEHLRDSMFSNDLSLNLIGVDLKSSNVALRVGARDLLRACGRTTHMRAVALTAVNECARHGSTASSLVLTRAAIYSRSFTYP